MNWFVVNKASNLVIGVVASSSTPTATATKSFIKANDKALTLYYKHLKKDPDVLLDIGVLMAKSPYIAEQVSKGKSGTASPRTSRLRDEPVYKHVDREQQIANWIKANPEATAHDLEYEFLTGIVAARAYISKYRY